MRMAVVPALNFKGTSGNSTPRFSARSTASQTSSFALSARHMMKPEVGMAASISALGDLTPPWSGGRAAIGCTGKTEPVFPAVDGRVPYNVGRTRARAQLKLALTTEEETSQLRRLHEALDSNRFDRCLVRELESATVQAQELSRKLGFQGGDIPAPATEGSAAESRKTLKKSKTREKVEESQSVPLENEAEVDAEFGAKQSAAATRIQAIQRGKQGRDAVNAKKKCKEEAELVEKQTVAATRIQAIQRGNSGRDVARKRSRESNDA